LTPFLHWARTRTPYVVLKSAMTLDGKTASAEGISQWITGPTARAYVHRLRQRLGAVMVGLNTAVADDPLLTVRRTHSTRPLPAPPARIVVDSRLSLPIDSRLVRSAGEAPLYIGCREDADEQAMGALRALGVEVLPVPARGGSVDIAILMAELGARGITGILLEGGGELAFSALIAGCAHEVAYFVAPKLMGGREALTPLSGAGYGTPDDAVPVSGLSVRRCGSDFILQGKVTR
jgi:diaminohydroxyphosphoribosylaminopyrimidine deaminase/5-amino-6-(5-phosphoribosylamino)uracil reductase